MINISVLMSVYYKEKPSYLKESIQSIINQTLQPNQIVIIKDGKLGKELEDILKEFKNKYTNLIDIYPLKENKGLGSALRYGVQKCKYEYIARMDTDDIAPLNRLEEQSKILNNSDIDILGGYIEECDENMKNVISIRKVPLESEEIKKYAKYQSPFNHGTVIIKKETLIKIGNYKPNIELEDYELWSRMIINNCKMKNIDKILGKFRTSKDMYKRRNGRKQIKKIIQIENILLDYKIINIFQYIYNILIRSILAITPVGIKKEIYKIIRRTT